MTDADETVASHLESAVSEALEARGAAAFVHVGFRDAPAIRYCRSALESRTGLERGSTAERSVVAVAFDGAEWLTATSADGPAHPADMLASTLSDRIGTGTILTPARVPHDAALYFERAGFDLASTDALARARATKTPRERERIADAQTAAGAGIRRAAAALADASIDDERRLVVVDEALTPGRLRRIVDEAIVSAGGFPAGNTVVDPDPSDAGEALCAGEPIVLEVAPRGPAGYYGGLVRTLVVDGDGGRERRAHVGATQSFRSAAAMLTAGTESVTAVEADLKAEVRAFGFGEADDVRTRVSGVGLEPAERPIEGGDEIEPRSVVRLESAVRVDGDRWLRIADLLANGSEGERATYLEAPSRSLEPSAMLE